MTGKRFAKYVPNSYGYTSIIIIKDNVKGKKSANIDDIVDLLNWLHEENEQLKQRLASINHLIDNKIDEFKNGDYGDLPFNTIHMFLDLKQEIGDVE